MKKKKHKMVIYMAVSENLTGLGGPMGSERTIINWQKHFHIISTAKRYCEQNYKEKTKGEKYIEKLQWYNDGDGFQTQDLGFVRYIIKVIKVK